jgi:hypothetical protein
MRNLEAPTFLDMSSQIVVPGKLEIFSSAMNKHISIYVSSNDAISQKDVEAVRA